MARLTVWKGPGIKTKDYQFFDRMSYDIFQIGGVEYYIHKYIGPVGATTDPTNPNANILDIQDMVNLEIRDRAYDPDIYCIKGHQPMSDTDFSMSQFGMFMSIDSIYITFHLNKMIEQLGRRITSGDVIEVIFMRDDTSLNAQTINKFYVVQEGTRPAEGYSPTWWPHLWRVKCSPLTDSQEFSQILNQAITDRGDGVPVPPVNTDGSSPTLADLMSTYNTDLAINNSILAEANAAVPFRNLQAQHFFIYMDDCSPRPVIQTIYEANGKPPNGSKPLGSGQSFPYDSHDGDYFLRVDYLPPVLYQFSDHKWKRVEIDYRSKWLPAGAVLASFINNNNTTTLQDGTTINEKTNLRQAILPKIDPDI